MHIRKEILKIDNSTMFLSLNTNTNIPMYVVEDSNDIMDSITFSTFKEAKEYLDEKKWDGSHFTSLVEDLRRAKEFIYGKNGINKTIITCSNI